MHATWLLDDRNGRGRPWGGTTCPAKKKKMDSEPPPFGEHDHTKQAQCTPFAAASPPALLATCTPNIRLANEQRNDNALLPKRRNERDASHHRLATLGNSDPTRI